MATKKCDLAPMGNWTVLERCPVEEKTPGGIVLPDTAEKSTKLTKAVVVAAGPGEPLYFAGTSESNSPRCKFDFKAGDTVVFEDERYGVHNFEIGGEKFVLVRASEIIAKIKI